MQQNVAISGPLSEMLLLLLMLLIGFALLGWMLYRWGGYRFARPWRAALVNVPLGIMLFDESGRRIFANSLADVLLQQIDSSQLAPSVTAGVQGLQQRVVVSGREGGLVQVQSWPLDTMPKHVLLTLRDIAQQQNGAANYRQFIHTLSHELLTPLTAIQGHLRHIQASTRSEQVRWQGSLQVVHDEVERLTRLTSNLLILSRLETGQPLQKRPTNLSAVVEEVVLGLLDKADAQQITLNVNTTPQLPRPTIDRDAWKQVFVNLIDNGIKYGKAGGVVTVLLRQNEAGLSIAVTDDGHGIPPDDLPHLFTEMFRSDAHRHVSGTGLGLAIVRKIVEQHGGQITCSSELGRGTTFHITLPVVLEPVAAR